MRTAGGLEDGGFAWKKGACVTGMALPPAGCMTLVESCSL